MKAFYALSGLLLIVALIIGCGQSSKPSSKAPAPEGQKYLLAVEPTGAKDVAAVKATSQDNDEVVVVGRIGGSVDPWDKGIASFTIADVNIKACSELEGDTCPTPWDFCCENQKELAKRVLLVQFQDDNGNVVESDARELFAVKELSTVVLRGKFKNDKDGVKLIADGMYVKK